MVYTIGESVLDIIIKDFENVKLKPGGSMLNTAISLGRLGIRVSHISYLAKDTTSEHLIEFLRNNCVDTLYIDKGAKKTNLALAYLDKQNNADYVFYKETNKHEVDLQFPEVKKNDIVLFGSLFCLNKSYRKSLTHFFNIAKDSGALIIYDPNFRKPHLPELEKLMPLIKENFNIADVVKGSDEDFKNILNFDNGHEVWNFLKNMNVKILVYTKGSKGVEIYSNYFTLKSNVERVKVKSTIGAGDTFSAGIIYSLVKNGWKKSNLEKISNDNWKQILNVAAIFAGEVCSSFDNYLSNEFVKKWKNV